MAEYIERKKLIKFACRHIDGKLDANDIARFPTADVVPVVRCCECIFSRKLQDVEIKNTNVFRYCFINSNFVEDNHYCSHGERRCDE